MAPPFSLLSAKWIPVKRADGSRDPIAPHEITSDLDSNPIVSFAWPRPDFDLAAHEFLIGLFAVAFPPKGQRDWLRYFRIPPTPEELPEAFQAYAAAFSLDGEGPRFLQDFSPLEGEPSPVEALFIEAPGANTVKLNKDLLVKRERIRVLSRASAAMALYTLQQFAPSGGAGHRTSLRGGGPLVTLVVPGAPDSAENGRPLTLWQKLWLHVPQSRPLDHARLHLAFPWLAPTKTSAKKESMSVSDADPLQAFFGMPRRIRLIFEMNEARRPCDLTGEVDNIVVTGFIAEPRGVNYGVFSHPLTPYYKIKTDTLPVHAPEGRVGYRQWLGLVYASADGSRLPASAVVEAQARLRNLDTSYGRNARLIAGGYAMDNMKALAFAETEMPLHAADPDLANRLLTLADHLVKAAFTAVSALGFAVKSALLGADAKLDSNSTLLDAPRERLWADTEREFHDVVSEAVTQFERSERDVEIALAEEWRGTLEQRALRIFDETAPLDDFGAIDPRQVVEARRFLVLAFKGFGKMGRGLFNELGLPAAQPKAGRSNEAKAKRKEDTRA
jgi:CRISPR system Cascade subunit CasA